MAAFAAKAITSDGRPVTGAYLVRLFIICLSYANLCFLNSWAEISDHGYDFLRKYAVTWQKVVAVTIDILIVAAVVWGILYLALASGRQLRIRAAKWTAMAGLLLPFNVIRTDENLDSVRKAYLPHAPALQISMVVLGTAVILFLLFNWERLSTRIASALLILLAPIMPLVVANAAWQVSTGPPASFLPNKPLQPALPQSADAPHVIWIIFDEWDQALTFRDRPADLSFPEIDRFQSESFHASRVYPPAQVTMLSGPSLLTGGTFIDSKPQVPNEVMLTYDRERPPVALTAQFRIFPEARHRGFNIRLNLVFVHMSVPHSPSIYRASSDTITDGPGTTYADNLRLVDRTICDLRHTLEESGMWDTSTILLTADHPLRVKNQYSWPDRLQAGLFCKQTAEVPYLLKMPGQKRALAYNKPMQEIVTKDLLLAIMDREVTTPQQVFCLAGSQSTAPTMRMSPATCSGDNGSGRSPEMTIATRIEAT